MILRTAHADKVTPEVTGLTTPISIWDVPEQGTRGPKGKYDRSAITAAAVRLADAGGLEAATMRAVAAELGMAPMSLYNYVPAKDHLIQLMTDRVGGEYRYQELPAAPRDAMVALARQGRDIARRHPWLPDAMRRPAVIGPNGLAYIDCFLGLLAGSALDMTAKMELISMVNGFSVSYGGLEQPGAGVSLEQYLAAQVATLVSAAATGNYPNLATALSQSAPSQQRDADEIFDSAVGRLIDGALAG
jgi:AcrR family transcriptional regulator